MIRWLFALVAGAVLGCGSAPKVASKPSAKPDPRVMSSASDVDADGLCDASESEVGSDKHAADTDGDTLTDLVEVAYAFDVLDATDPPAERLVFLQGRAGASIDFAVRATVTGMGDEQTGTFEADPTPYDDQATAEEFFLGATAVSAEPRENVRGIDSASERFVSVLGETRLGFSLRFQHPGGDIASCIRAYPFRYAIKSSRGELGHLERYLLVVIPPAASLESGPWCGLDPCL